MRLKQLLGTILLATVITAPAQGAVSQLGGVQVEPKDHASVVTIRANGTFTHTEYHPTDTLMLVDLAGVSVAKPDASLHTVASGGVQSYRVVGYRSASGAEVTRVELNLTSGATVKVNEVAGGLALNVSARPAAETAKPAAEKVATEKVAAAPMPTVRASVVRNIAVAHGADGLSIEITGTGPMTAKTMKLTGPDRVVLDIPNSILEGRTRQISVNSNDVKTVRAAHYQSVPPATRVVVDLAVMHEFEVVPGANKLVLKLKTSAAAPVASPEKSAPTAVAVAGKAADTQPASVAVEKKPADAQPATVQPIATQPTATEPAAQSQSSQNQPSPSPKLMVVNLTPPRDETKAPEKMMEASAARSEHAASHFSSSDPAPMPSSNLPIPAVSSSLNASPAVVNAALLQQQQTPSTASSTPMSTGCTSGRYTGEPVNLDLRDFDIKDFFRLIHELSGLNVVLDPSVKGLVTIDVTDIPWDQALALVLRNNGLECELQGNVLRIATLDTLKTEADARRAHQEAQALQVPKQTYTRYLSYAHSRDVMPIVKKFLSARGDVVSDERSNAVIIEDIPATLPKIDDLLTKLDRKTPEVEIEARVVAATRTFARDIGTQIGFGWGNKPSAVGGGTGTPSPISITPPAPPLFLTAPGDLTKIPLFSNLPATGPTSGISLTNFSSIYRLDFVLSMAESRGLVKILSRPRVVTQNNILALVKQGSRIPVVTQAQLGGPPTVTYVESFLRLTVTPQITADNTIFLQVDVENTTPDFSRVSGAQLNPTLNTQQTTTQVLVSDGQTVVIGGVIQTQNSLAIAQVPLLGSIPILGNLFKHTAINTSTQELIFFITPKIIQT